MENKNLSLANADEILQLLEEPTEDRRPLKHKLRREASVKELVKALWNSKTILTSRILCDILGARRAKTAIPALLNCLNQPDPDLKNDAAEAIGKIGSPKAGEELLDHFILEPRGWYAIALGAIGYSPAIPYLIKGLSNASDWLIRGGSAWALGELRVKEAIKPLESSLVIENDKYAFDRMNEAITKIREINQSKLK
jgi:HEAT repeat protein